MAPFDPLSGSRNPLAPFVVCNRPYRCTGVGLSTPEEYQRRAADLLRIAQETHDPTNKALLLEMAQAWLKLAERARVSKDKTEP